MRGKPTAFIDADIILHRAVSFCEKEFDGEPMYDINQAVSHFKTIQNQWLKQAGKLSDYYLVVSVGQNFRKALYPDYKANRKDIIPHPALEGLKAEVMTWMDVIWEEGIEADDLIGIRCSENPKKTLAISADKDFATVPCNLMIPISHGRKKPDWHEFSEDEANMNWLRQTITGDAIDNYKGIPRVGKVGAEKALPRPAPLDVMWENVRRLFIEKGLTEEDAILQARLARILRHGEYDFFTKEVKLWTPTPAPTTARASSSGSKIRE